MLSGFSVFSYLIPWVTTGNREKTRKKAVAHRIDLVDTLTGFRHNFTHIYGRMVELASSAIIFPGDIEIKSSEGMAVYEGNENFGYFIITYQVDFPIPLMMNKKFKWGNFFSVFLKSSFVCRTNGTKHAGHIISIHDSDGF